MDGAIGRAGGERRRGGAGHSGNPRRNRPPRSGSRCAAPRRRSARRAPWTACVRWDTGAPGSGTAGQQAGPAGRRPPPPPRPPPRPPVQRWRPRTRRRQCRSPGSSIAASEPGVRSRRAARAIPSPVAAGDRDLPWLGDDAAGRGEMGGDRRAQRGQAERVARLRQAGGAALRQAAT